MNQRNDNWYGINTEKANETFEGGLTYLNTFCVNNEYDPSAVYKVASPNREKGHKEYLLLVVQRDPITERSRIVIRGMDYAEIIKFGIQDGIRCLKCEDVLYSVNRHHMNVCTCKACAIDGGKDYVKITGNNEDYELVTIDLLKNEISSKPLG